MGYGGVVRVCLVAYPAPWGVPLEVALLQRAALTFARILEAQKISSTDVAGNERCWMPRAVCFNQYVSWIDPWLGLYRKSSLNCLYHFCFWRNARHRVGWWFAVGSGSSFQLSMFTPGLFANSRSMQKGNAQLVHNPLSTATAIVCPWSFAVNVKPSTLTSSSIGHFFKN